jgi:catechol 2,3-dioxygenase-like lactoylglutathione lyase family enzyme
VVFFVKDVQACERFYVENFGFVASDRYPSAAPSCAAPMAATTTSSCCSAPTSMRA